ncbi:MAG: hypothetical protein RL481_417 [Pseudomonadota bacterium]|jgi:hypothetical protein
MYALALLLIASSLQPDADIADANRQEIYQSFLSCAAFHTIEASKMDGTAVDAQKALAVDHAEAAAVYASDGKAETTNVDLQRTLDDFKGKLETGDPRDMAEQWTGLESACAELYSIKDRLVRERKSAGSDEPEEK